MKHLMIVPTGELTAEGLKKVTMKDDPRPPVVETPEGFDPRLILAIDVNHRVSILAWGKNGRHPAFAEELFTEHTLEKLSPGVYEGQWAICSLGDELLASAKDAKEVQPFPGLLHDSLYCILSVRDNLFAEEDTSDLGIAEYEETCDDEEPAAPRNGCTFDGDCAECPTAGDCEAHP